MRGGRRGWLSPTAPEPITRTLIVGSPMASRESLPSQSDTSAGSLFGDDAEGPPPAPAPDANPTPAPPPPPTTEAPDPFDPDALRLPQDFAGAVGVKKLLITLPVRKPSKEWFVRTHPDPAYRLQTAVLELKEDQETYLVAAPLREALAGESTFSPRLLVLAANRQGVLFVWPLKLPDPDGRSNPWHQSALEAEARARTQWVRVSANMAAGAYDVAVAPMHGAEPTWPEMSMAELLRIAFRDRLIDRYDHPVLMRLRGEA